MTSGIHVLDSDAYVKDMLLSEAYRSVLVSADPSALSLPLLD